jgi:hypothetical protein
MAKHRISTVVAWTKTHATGLVVIIGLAVLIFALYSLTHWSTTSRLAKELEARNAKLRAQLTEAKNNPPAPATQSGFNVTAKAAHPAATVMITAPVVVAEKPWTERDNVQALEHLDPEIEGKTLPIAYGEWTVMIPKELPSDSGNNKYYGFIIKGNVPLNIEYYDDPKGQPVMVTEWEPGIGTVSINGKPSSGNKPIPSKKPSLFVRAKVSDKAKGMSGEVTYHWRKKDEYRVEYRPIVRNTKR